MCGCEAGASVVGAAGVGRCLGRAGRQRGRRAGRSGPSGRGFRGFPPYSVLRDSQGSKTPETPTPPPPHRPPPHISRPPPPPPSPPTTHTHTHQPRTTQPGEKGGGAGSMFSGGGVVCVNVFQYSRCFSISVDVSVRVVDVLSSTKFLNTKPISPPPNPTRDPQNPSMTPNFRE